MKDFGGFGEQGGSDCHDNIQERRRLAAEDEPPEVGGYCGLIGRMVVRVCAVPAWR